MRDLEHLYSTTASPGDGITVAHLSAEPLATEGEATPGPDDENPFESVQEQGMVDKQRPDADDELFSMVPADPVVEFDDPDLPEF